MEEDPPEKPKPTQDASQGLQDLIPFGKWSLNTVESPTGGESFMWGMEDIVWDFSKNQVQVTIKERMSITSQPLSSTSLVPIKENGAYPINMKKPNEIVINNVTYQFYIELILDGGISTDAGYLITFKRAKKPFEGLSQEAKEKSNRDHTLLFGEWSLIAILIPFNPTESFNEGGIVWKFSKNKVEVTINVPVNERSEIPFKTSGTYATEITKPNIILGYKAYMRLILENKDNSTSDKSLTFNQSIIF